MTATALLPLRVMVLDVWDQFDLDVEPAATVDEFKHEALARARVPGDPDAYVVKFRGYELLDGTRSLADAGVVPHASLIVLARRRRPVR